MEELVSQMKEAILAYGKWAERTGDYPHDEDGCEAHEALLVMYEKLKVWAKDGALNQLAVPVLWGTLL